MAGRSVLPSLRLRGYGILGEHGSLYRLRTRPITRRRREPTLYGRSIQQRFLSSRFQQARQNLLDANRQHPILLPFALLCVWVTMSGLLYAIWVYMSVRVEMGGYPEAIGVKLRRARYFTDHHPDRAQALKAYLAATKMAEEEGMHPLSNEVMGIWIELARFMELNGGVKQSIEILEKQRWMAMAWVEKYGNVEGCASDRTRLLQKAIVLASKIGELFSSPYYPDKEKSEEYLVWSVETLLKENERRRKEGLKPGEGELGIDRDQQGAQLEALGHNFEEKDNFFFASQLFLQALMLKQTQDCHSVVLMNNIAAAIAQQKPLVEPGEPPPSPAQLRDSGRAWARKALELASSIKPPQRNNECDVGCSVATHNLGEFAEMDGNVAEARERYEEAGSIAHATNFGEGVISANEGLKRLSAPPVKKVSKGYWFYGK